MGIEVSSFGWAIISPGAIAHRFAEAVVGTPGAHLAVICGRDHSRAERFATEWTREGTPEIRATSKMEEVLQDASVHAVYIASPHAFHADAVRACLKARKPVLCEKPLVPNLEQGIELAALAKVNNTFLMEAVWTRFLPIYTQIRNWLQSGAIGGLRGMQSSFCFNSPFNPNARHFDAAQAGGALLDIGIYNLTVTRWLMTQVYGVCPNATHIQASGMLGPTGVDHRVNATIEFDPKIASQFICSFDSTADNAFRIYGENGTITIAEPFWGATQAILKRPNEAPVTANANHKINGFEYELEEVMRCVSAGETQSKQMPLSESLATLEWMDKMRAQMGVKYSFE
jgi:predicted dehydrogenase